MIRFASTLCLLPLPAMAGVPTVMTDIVPLQSLTAQVMGDLGAPAAALLPPGADPHDFSLRPSDAERLADAEIIFWVGESLTPWMKEQLQTLAPQAVQFSLLETTGWTPLEVRELEEFAVFQDGETIDADPHDDDGDIDPHAWLDPVIAGVWTQKIAAELARIDPENAAVYRANADATVARLAALTDDIAAQFDGLTDRAYVLPHDGYQYFEARFGLTALGAFSGIDARTPGPAQVAALRAELAGSNVACVMSDAEIGDRWAQLITEGTSANTTQIDGVGVGLVEGTALYEQMVRRLADNFAQCLGTGS